jgi:hypothetical protein
MHATPYWNLRYPRSPRTKRPLNAKLKRREYPGSALLNRKRYILKRRPLLSKTPFPFSLIRLRSSNATVNVPSENHRAKLQFENKDTTPGYLLSIDKLIAVYMDVLAF